MSNTDIHTYYQTVISIIDDFIGSADNEYEAYEKLSRLNKEYKDKIGEEHLVTSIVRANYSIFAYEDYINNPNDEGLKEIVEYMQNHWVPSSFC